MRILALTLIIFAILFRTYNLLSLTTFVLSPHFLPSLPPLTPPDEATVDGAHLLWPVPHVLYPLVQGGSGTWA